MHHNKNENTNRRQFLKTTSAGSLMAMTPVFFSAPRPMTSEYRCLNDKVPIGLIGAGGMGVGNMKSAREWVDVVAIADADQGRAERANKDLSDGKADVDPDYRKILDRDDINVVHVATPDHWHTKPVVEAMLAGKDVYCEKPLTLTIDEGKLIRKTQQETGRIVQVGTQQRSQFNLFTKAMAIVAEGRLGKIKKLQCAIGGAPESESIPAALIPEGLDWDRWLGPAPKTEFRHFDKVWTDKQGKERSARRNNNHYEFRWWYEYSGGKLTDWGAHHVDIAIWALRVNGQSTDMLSIDGTAEHPVDFKDGIPVQKDRYNTATKFNFTAQMADGVEVVIRNDTDNGCLIEGENGRIFVNRGKLVGKPVEDLKENPLPDNALQNAYKGLPMEKRERQAHWLNFLHCHKQQVEPISDVHSHMEMLNICHLAGIAARLGRKINWDPRNEKIIADDMANRMLSRPYRDGYEIDTTP